MANLKSFLLFFRVYLSFEKCINQKAIKFSTNESETRGLSNLGSLKNLGTTKWNTFSHEFSLPYAKGKS